MEHVPELFQQAFPGLLKVSISTTLAFPLRVDDVGRAEKTFLLSFLLLVLFFLSLYVVRPVAKTSEEKG